MLLVVDACSRYPVIHVVQQEVALGSGKGSGARCNLRDHFQVLRIQYLDIALDVVEALKRCHADGRDGHEDQARACPLRSLCWTGALSHGGQNRVGPYNNMSSLLSSLMMALMLPQR